ncbi:MAG: LysR family transcriptional regulator [Anaerovoracaceae bacterium]|jgi:DNA-binding transcriptional LysR family regulator
MNLTLQQLKYVVAVAEAGSINQAAEKLFISQPSLSAAIQAIEKNVGRMLFKRSPRGMQLTADGAEFLGYARQVLQQMDMLEDNYRSDQKARKRFSVSTQHYTFAANAFVELVKHANYSNYEFSLIEGRTSEIIENVHNMKSELGIIYLSDFNESVIRKLLSDDGLTFTSLFTAAPHVFLCRTHPLADRAMVTLDDLDEYPYITYDQGIDNSFYFSEELLSTRQVEKHIIVSDRAAVVNFLIGLDAYTISTGVFPAYLHGDDIIAVPLKADEHMEVGFIQNRHAVVSPLGELYIEALRKIADDID